MGPSVSPDERRRTSSWPGTGLLVFGLCVAFEPLESLVEYLQDNNDDDDHTTIDRVRFVGQWFQLAAGMWAVGFGVLGSHNLSMPRLGWQIALALLPTAAIPFLADMVQIGQEATAPYDIDSRTVVVHGQQQVFDYVENPWIPADYLPTERDVRFVAAMNMLGLLAYTTAFLGSIAVCIMHLWTPHQPMFTAHSTFMISCFVLILAGMSQVLLGAYLLLEYNDDDGWLDPPIGGGSTLYLISSPVVAVVVGAWQTLVGYGGVAIHLHMLPSHVDESMLFLWIGLPIQWISMLGLQFLTQYGGASSTRTTSTRSIQSLALYSVALSGLPAFLFVARQQEKENDYKDSLLSKPSQGDPLDDDPDPDHDPPAPPPNDQDPQDIFITPPPTTSNPNASSSGEFVDDLLSAEDPEEIHWTGSTDDDDEDVLFPDDDDDEKAMLGHESTRTVPTSNRNMQADQEDNEKNGNDGDNDSKGWIHYEVISDDDDGDNDAPEFAGEDGPSPKATDDSDAVSESEPMPPPPRSSFVDESQLPKSLLEDEDDDPPAVVADLDPEHYASYDDIFGAMASPPLAEMVDSDEEGDISEDTPDDATADLEERLDDLEKEISGETMDSFMADIL